MSMSRAESVSDGFLNVRRLRFRLVVVRRLRFRLVVVRRLRFRLVKTIKPGPGCSSADKPGSVPRSCNRVATIYLGVPLPTRSCSLPEG